MAKLTKPQDRLTKAHIRVMTSPEFCMFSGVLSIGDVTFTQDIPTACTNGRDVMYNPDFVDTLNDKELTFLVLHEAIHKAFQHMTMWKKLFKEDARLANMAADYVVNSSILEADPNSRRCELPEGALIDKRYNNMTTKQIFDLLKKNPPPQGGKGSSSKSGTGKDSGETLDSHDWEGAEKMSEEEKKTTQKQIDQALRQGEVIRGKMQGNVNRGVKELLEPQVNWREQLRDFVTTISRSKDETSFRRPHRRFIGQDIYMPSMVGNSINKIILAGDLSGSISKETERVFITEMIQVCKDVNPNSIDLLWWDSAVQGHETYLEGDYDTILQRTKPSGGGGTLVSCVNRFIEQKRLEPDVVIILTDGYVENDWGGHWNYPTLWAITDKRNVSPHGKSIYIDE
tara:strand:+ start:1601 stop:2797 length:1197 start_codon:yes stop_codon:yes gene_type:complete